MAIPKIKIIVTLGPSTNKESDLRKIKDKGVDFVRINMSHSSIEDLRYFLPLAKKIGLPFIIDTEGSQIRTGDLSTKVVNMDEGQEVKIYNHPIVGNENAICLKPGWVVEKLEAGDLIHLDFDTLILRVTDTAPASRGFVIAKTITAGFLGKNKAVIIDPASPKKFELPPLSEKDYQSIDLGLKYGTAHIAASFMRSAAFVKEVKKATKNQMKIISKIECADGLANLDEIINESDYLLIDRGDLSKEIPIEKIPLIQKLVINRARKRGKGVFVATNLLETMIEQKRPTRAEVHDVISTILDGVEGLTLAGETAIGKYPIECINTLNKLIKHITENVNPVVLSERDSELVSDLEKSRYLYSHSHSALIAPHGGKLVDRFVSAIPSEDYLRSLPKIQLSESQQMDVEQIGTGAFSPLEGFMGEKDFRAVLDNLRLANGLIWPLPIVLDIDQGQSDKLAIGTYIGLADDYGEVMAILHLEEKYIFDKNELALKLYGTDNTEHPGVKSVMKMKPVLIGGKIDLLKRRRTGTEEYNLTPRQTRKLFDERGWSKVAGFHTRNVIHRGHEFIQMEALNKEYCDGLFIHPVIGIKKSGDFNPKYIVRSYEIMMKNFYPKNKIVFSTFPTFSRYAGPREALFTAICRKNFGCSHFIVGRDHTGVGNFYASEASQKIFENFPDLGIQVIAFSNIFYSRKLRRYIHEKDNPNHAPEDKLKISGTEARSILRDAQMPPEWLMRPEISKNLIEAIKNGEKVFVADNPKGTAIWFTGLSGSGKTTIAAKLQERFNHLGKKSVIIDGDAVRNTINKHLGFSREDIKENNRRIALLAKEKLTDVDFVLIPVIAPFKEDRLAARSVIGENFLEIFVDAPIAVCSERDPKGLYKKVFAGEIKNFIGFNNGIPYETPEKPDIHLKTHELTLDDCVNEILKHQKLIKNEDLLLK